MRVQGEAEDAGGLAPTKDDNEAMRSLTRRTCLFICLDCYKVFYQFLYIRIERGLSKYLFSINLKRTNCVICRMDIHSDICYTCHSDSSLYVVKPIYLCFCNY